MTVLRLSTKIPTAATRTTNMLDRFIPELRRREKKVVGIFPNDESA